jgi:hypothetical protein
LHPLARSINNLKEEIRKELMIRNYNDEDRRSVSKVHVTASLAQQILEACIIESTIGKLTTNIRDLSYYDLKKYLFYLITFGHWTYEIVMQLLRLNTEYRFSEPYMNA